MLTNRCVGTEVKTLVLGKISKDFFTFQTRITPLSTETMSVYRQCLALTEAMKFSGNTNTAK